MKYYTIAPPPRLAPYVRCFWVFEGEASADRPYIYRGYADGCAEMVFHYRSDFDTLLHDGTTEKGWAAGLQAQTRHVSRNITFSDFGIFGCYLYPYAIPRIFGIAANELTNQMPDVHSIFGADGRELEERIIAAAGNSERVSILSTFLESRLGRESRDLPDVVRSVNHIIETRGMTDIASLAKTYAMSRRSFERKFKEFAGFSPKLYSRIARFQNALKHFGGAHQSLTDIAYDCGYYDQSHFINDFREFSGYNPGAYFSGRAEGSEYLGG